MLQVQFEQLRQNVFVAHSGIPAVGGEDYGVELLVGYVEPGRALVVEVRQRAFLEVGGGLGILGDQTRIANGADAARVGVMVAVIVVAAVSRSKDSKGRSTYDGDALNLASFRESSELEFGADDAFILVRDPDDLETGVILKHLKARHTEAKDIVLTFDRPRQRFTPRTSTPPPSGKLLSTVANLWGRTAAADDESEGDE